MPQAPESSRKGMQGAVAWVFGSCGSGQKRHRHWGHRLIVEKGLWYLRKATTASGEVQSGFTEEMVFDMVSGRKRRCPEGVRTA